MVEEIDEKIATDGRRGRWAGLQLRSDGKLLAQTTMSVSTVLRARRGD